MNTRVSAYCHSVHWKMLKDLIASVESVNDLFGVLFELCFFSNLEADAFSCDHVLQKKCEELKQKTECYFYRDIEDEEKQSEAIEGYNKIQIFEMRRELYAHFEQILHGYYSLPVDMFFLKQNPFLCILEGESSSFTVELFNAGCRYLLRKEKTSENGMPEAEELQTNAAQETELPLQQHDTFDFIKRIEVDGLSFTIYYGDYEKDVVYPNTFPKCYQYKKLTNRWQDTIKALTSKNPTFTTKERFNINESFKLFFKNKGIACKNVLDEKDKIAIKNITVKSHSDSYRREQNRSHNTDSNDENGGY